MAEIRQIQVDGVNYDLVISEDEVSATAAAQSAAQALAYKNQAQSSAAQAGQQATNASNQADRAEDAALRAEAIVGGEFVSYGQAQGLADAQKAQARSNIDAANDSDVVKITAQTLTSVEQAQARANIMAGGSNDNLLDNAYFVGGGSQLGDGIFPVNQRGQTSYTGGGTTFDRWRLSSGGSMTLAPEGVSVNGLMYQKKVLDLTVGDTYTLSRRNTDGTIVSITGIVPSAEGWAVGNQNFGVYFRPSTKVCDIQIWGEYFLQAIKLEKGSVSTLANDVPPDFGEELAKCQRYLFILDIPAYFYIGCYAVAGDATHGTFVVHTPVNMSYHVITASIQGSLEVSTQGTIASIQWATAFSNAVNIAFALSSGSMVNGVMYPLQTSTETKLILSCEL